jgi:hypothetical protein
VAIPIQVQNRRKRTEIAASTEIRELRICLLSCSLPGKQTSWLQLSGNFVAAKIHRNQNIDFFSDIFKGDWSII